LRQTLATLAELPFSVWQAARILDRAAPAVVFSMGGYVAGPVLLAAVWKRIPIVIMEPNAIPGFTHRRLARFVSRALLSFAEAQRWFPKGRSEVTGMPIREEFFAIPPKPCGSVVTVLITGGSQGSRTLNRAAEESWPLWDRSRIRLIHQIGSRMYSELAPKFNESGMPGEAAEFLTDMPRAFSEADLVVSRAGMGAVRLANGKGESGCTRLVALRISGGASRLTRPSSKGTRGFIGSCDTPELSGIW
jgi:UDP-N-acetylglucosamine--N-acetylmuramyl-(pentapeptide) pyrophosphoryl-undecaprenol N-acetylglucosamine transferase